MPSITTARSFPVPGALLALAVLAIQLGLATTPAYAGSTEDEITRRIEAKAEEASKHFAAKDFAKAVRAYTEAYQIAQRPSELLYNIAFIYDSKLQEYEMASVYYKKYAAASDADPALVEKAIRRMGELRNMKTKPPKKPDPDTKDPDTKVANVTKPGPATSSSDTGDGQRLGGIAALVTGGVMMLAGGGLYVGAMTTNDSFQTAPGNERADLANSGRSMALAGDVLMGVGGVAALVGVILFATAPSASEGAGSVNVSATVLPQGAGLVIGGSL